MVKQTTSCFRWVVAAAIGFFVFPPLARSQDELENPDDNHWSEAILPSDRESVRHYGRISQLISERRFGDAVVLLDQVLAAPEDSFFHPAGDKRQFRSLKSESLRTIQELPLDGMATYRLQFGARAKKMLQRATATGQIAILEEVARRYFHTQSGYEAALLLGRHHLDSGRPLQAAICFQQLLDTPDAQRAYGPTLAVLAAASWARADMEERALETISSMLATPGFSQVQIGGRKIEPAEDVETASEWLRRVVGEQISDLPTLGEQWITFRGNAARNAKSDGDRPLLSPRWRQRTADDPAVEKIVQQIRNDYDVQNIAAIPRLQPLAVGDTVLMRTAQKLVAVDFQTGRRVWEARPAASDSVSRSMTAHRGNGNRNWATQLAMLLDQRLWDDAVYGSLSSDGKRVYLIRDLGWPMRQANQMNRAMAIPGQRLFAMRAIIGRNAFPQAGARSNRLAALDLKTEGKLVWEVGGPNTDSPELDGVFFLGAPLAISGELFCLVEIKSGIRLLVLDAQTGKLRWSQQLADVERDIAHNTGRRLSGASPSYANGILVCPTSAGAIVAVDLAKRSLLWAYQYPQQPTPGNFRRQMALAGNSRNRSDSRWVDSSPILVDGHVLLTPVEAMPQRLYCLDLLKGTLTWQHDRDECLYVGCVHDDSVVLIGRTNITVIHLRTGKTVWEKGDCPLPEGSLPSGRGFYADAYYYLPLSSQEVVKIDLSNGQIVDHSKSRNGIIPGNLICHRGSVVSLGPDSLDAFYQIEPLRDRVNLTLAEDPNDTEALMRQGELALDQDDIKSAVASFRHAYQLAPTQATRDLLVTSLIRGLRNDFATYRESAVELDSLVEDPSLRATFYRLMAHGLHTAARRPEALNAYLKLIDLNGDTTEMVRDSESRTVRLDRWIQSQLLDLSKAARPDERREIEAVVESHKAALGAEATKAELHRFLDTFGDITESDDVRERLARILLAEGNLLKCEMILRRLESSASVVRRGAATALMAELLRQAGRTDQAAHFDRRLNTEFADQVCLDGKTGAQLVAALPAADLAHSAPGGPDHWPRGLVKVRKVATKGNVRQRKFTTPFEIRDTLQPFFDKTTVAMDISQRAIVGFDSYGKEQFRATLGQRSSSNIGISVNARNNVGSCAVSGHLLVCSLGTRVVAIDTLRAKSVGTDRPLWGHDLQPSVLIPRTSHQIRFQWNQGAGGVRRAFITNGRAERVGSLGPVLTHGVILQHGRDVVCVDPASGADVWVLEGMDPGSTLFGDDEVLLIVPPGAMDAAVVATVVRPRDGKLLGTRPVPAVKQRLALVGRRVLQFSEVGKKVELKLVDPWQKQDIWKRQFDAYSRVDVVDGDAVAVMQRSGKFQLLSIEDASVRIEAKLETEPRLTSIRLERYRDLYLLMAAVPSTSTIASNNVTALNGTRDLFTGHIYALDRHSGRSLWTAPAQVRLKGLLAYQPSDLPVLTFAELHTRKKKSGQRVQTVSLLCLDKRTGRPVLQKTSLSNNDRIIVLGCDPEEKIVTISVRSGTYQLTFTDEPIAPEPPF